MSGRTLGICARTSGATLTFEPSISAPDPLALGVEQRFLRHGPGHPSPEDLDLDVPADLRRGGWHVRVRDRPSHRVTVATAGHAANDLPIRAHGLLAQGDRPGILQHQANEG